MSSKPIVKPDWFTDEMYFAWLLRGDIQASLKRFSASEEERQKDFLMWWLLHGREEYRAASRPTRGQIEVASEIVVDPPSLPMSRLIRAVLRARDDVRQVFDPTTEEGIEGLHRWFYVFGVPEFRLHDLLTEAELDYLAAPADGIPDNHEPHLSRLQFFLWLARDDLRQAFLIANPEGRESFLAWLLNHGWAEQGLYPYLRPSDLVTLMTIPAHFQSCKVAPINRLSWYVWKGDPELRGRCDLETAEGRRNLEVEVNSRLRSEKSLRPIWDLLNSRSLRQQTLDTASRLPLPPLPQRLAHWRGARIGVNLVGYAMGELGIGEDLRMMAFALKAAGVEFCILNRQPGPSTRQMDFSVVEYLAAEPRYPITLICMTGFDTAQLWLDRPDWFESTYVIGFWPWELPRWPEPWRLAFLLVDEIWASSNYTADAFATDAQVPVVLQPMAVTMDQWVPRTRAELGLPDERFLFLFVFDFMSYPARKNPEGAIRAFKTAFPKGDEPVNLVLKISNIPRESPKWIAFRKAISKDKRILVIAETMEKGDVLALMNACDVYVSLHRSEGFGRTMAEAMLLAKPVIATGYSGNADFVTPETGYPVRYRVKSLHRDDYPFGEGLSWAEPELADAAKAMRRLFDYPQEARQRALAGRDFILARHSPANVGRGARECLLQIAARMALPGDRADEPLQSWAPTAVPSFRPARRRNAGSVKT